MLKLVNDIGSWYQYCKVRRRTCSLSGPSMDVTSLAKETLLELFSDRKLVIDIGLGDLDSHLKRP